MSAKKSITKKMTKKSAAPAKKVAPKNKPTAPAANKPAKPKGGKKKFQLLRGMRDILPQEQMYWDFVRQALDQVSRAYGYSRIDVPVVEELQLFKRTIGEGTDVVDKEMYEFETKGEDQVALRPEFTAGVVRAYVEHGMVNQPQPVKLWSDGPLFRYDRPQAGRYRQFHQGNWEIIGSPQPALDAELIAMGYNMLSDLGLPVTVLINSLGTPDTRKQYVNALKDYLKPHRKQLDETSQERFNKNPLRILDSKDERTREILEGAPQIVDFLDDESREHFMSVLEYLDESAIPYRLDSKLVRGLDYYSHTTFEFILDPAAPKPAVVVDGEVAAESDVVQTEVASAAEVSAVTNAVPIALGGGGRYNYLVEMLGGAPGTPAVGMAMGLERIILAIKELQVEVVKEPTADVFLAQIGETARKRALKLFEELRQSGIAVMSNISKNRLSDQLSLASNAEAKYTLILGQKEMIDNTIIVRDMSAGSQETIDQAKLIATLKKLLKK